MAWLRESDEGVALTDVQLVVGNAMNREQKTFPVHRSVICARSEYFRALLAGGFREASLGSDISKSVMLPDVDPAAFDLVLTYLYTGHLAVKQPRYAEECTGLMSVDKDLLEAVRAGDRLRAASALSAGADVDARDASTGETALHILASSSGPAEEIAIEIVALLVSAGSDMNASLPSGETPLQLMASSKRKLVARALVVALQVSSAKQTPSGATTSAEVDEGEAPVRDEPDDDIDADALSSVLSILVCADRFGLDHLGLLCQQWLARALRPGNACELLEVADDLGCAQLRFVCVHFLKRNRRCRITEAFQALPIHLQEEVSVAAESL
eukprot:TRINITY_DN22433_c0_g1_i1.p1 TRINITY_DN22433_c0_g1~~TRINITY_DN22433_c0_g1_i1.p1  ORF type:complete len:367 (-),score=74.91 TRINITY_DN22433_c0_g1_i1:234-1217(-)